MAYPQRITAVNILTVCRQCGGVGTLAPMAELTPENFISIRQAVDTALDLAASVTLPKFREPIDVRNKLAVGFDPVTQADREAEQVLRDSLMKALPHAGFLGEEDSVPPKIGNVVDSIRVNEALQKQLTWVVDPIDGTRAFITGLPLWGTLVALNDGKQVVFGALDQPWLQERFVGWDGQAERIHKGQRSPLRTRAPRALSEAILQTTTPDMFNDESSLAGFNRVKNAAAMTRYGGDCYAYALLAMGGIDAVIESSLQPYDIQALIPIVEGAGGVITNWEGLPCLDGGRVIAAANHDIHAQLIAELGA